MIVSRTPYRVSWAGGGTDLPAFCDVEPGAVLSCTIDRHIHVAVNRRFERNWLIRGIETERVGSINEIQHDLVREALKLTGVMDPLEVTMIGDVPAGTGLGSSSSLTVGLLNALHAYQGRTIGAADLAAQACEIEIDILGKPIGRQDQYAAAFGGINHMVFGGGGLVNTDGLVLPERTLAELERMTMMFYTGRTRTAADVLREQSVSTAGCMATLRKLRQLSWAMWVLLASDFLHEFSKRLHQAWELKRSIGCGIATPLVDKWYAVARKAGALGGKLLGAGGGGFLLLMAAPEKHAAIREALGHPRELPFRIDPQGSRLVLS